MEIRLPQSPTHSDRIQAWSGTLTNTNPLNPPNYYESFTFICPQCGKALYKLHPHISVLQEIHSPSHQ